MNQYQELAKACKCCTKHVPLPTVLRMWEETIVCPTTFANAIEYKRLWESFGSRPMGSIRKHFSEYVQQLVESSIDKINTNNVESSSKQQ